MEAIVALAAFSFVSAVTPGPNNVLLWASGATFGLARTVPQIAGTAVGIGAMALAAAAGLAAIVGAVPALAVAMKVAGSAYLLLLAWRIAGARGMAGVDLAHPLGLVQAAVFQVLNPKAWVFALGAVTTFRPPDLPAVAGSVAVAATMIAVVIPSAALWAAAGGTINRLLTSDARRRSVSLALAALVALTVVSVWI